MSVDTVDAHGCSELLLYIYIETKESLGGVLGEQVAVCYRAAINNEGYCRVTVHADSRAVLTCPDGSEEDLEATRDALSEQQVDEQCEALCPSRK